MFEPIRMIIFNYQKYLVSLKFNYFLLISMAVLSGCISVPTLESRHQKANDLAQQSGWDAATLATAPYQLRAYLPIRIEPTDTLNIYIEGDGLAWRSRRRISNDPTPINPVALQLALQDSRAAAYLARPCQYVSNPSGCDPSLWTSARFSADVIRAMNQAINLLKQKFQAKRLRLIGYSGGGAVAALVAARRDDVSQLITVAGNLDHVAWTQHHKVSPLNHSLNPADAWQSLLDIPQIHFIGQDDRIVGFDIANAYRSRFPAKYRPQVRVIPGADHYCCWVDKWPELLESIQTAQ